MKIVLFGDSITDMCRNRNVPNGDVYSYGSSYSFVVASKLAERDPLKYEVVNRGISGDRIVDLYARMRRDVWREKPDVLSILIGINDIWHELDGRCDGVELVRWERMYRMLLDDTKKAFPALKLMICEPFVLHGSATDEHFAEFSQVKEYARVAKNIAKDYNAAFVPLQAAFDEAAQKYGASTFLSDGVHPAMAGATLIANRWYEVFSSQVDKKE
jgi:lysophospholipase L1-like esterase